MFRAGLLALALSFAAFSCGASQSAVTTATGNAEPETAHGLETILADDMRRHVEELASDAYEGRDTLEPGYQKAADYIAAAFEDYGLSPFPGQPSFQVAYPLEKSGFDQKNTELVITTATGERRVQLGSEGTPFTFSDNGSAAAEIVFAGYGIHAPEKGWDDYKDLKVKDKWVLVLRHAPGYEGNPAGAFHKSKRPGEAAFLAKAMTAQKMGAKGMLLVTGPRTAHGKDDLSWSESLGLVPSAEDKAKREAAKAKSAAELAATQAAAAKKGASPNAKAKVASETLLAFHIAPEVAQELVGSQDLGALQDSIDKGTPAKVIALKASVSATVKRSDEPEIVHPVNLIGYLEGSDPVLKDEMIVIGGHFDHIGRGNCGRDTIDRNDDICNGADDNASGTAGVLELAQAYGKGPRPKRSMVFVGFSAEEKGLLGSRALVEVGPIDTRKVAFMLNLDMIGRNPNRPMEFVGGEFAIGLRELAEKHFAAMTPDIAAEKLFLDEAPPRCEDEAHTDHRLYFGRYASNSDHDSFYRKEVPVAFFFTQTHADYHNYGDHADKIRYQRMQKIVRLGYAITSDLANADKAPAFVHSVNWLGANIYRDDSGSEAVARVLKVNEESRGAEAGLRVGDVLVRVGSNAVSDGKVGDKSIGAALDAIEMGSKSTLVVMREGKEHALDVERAAPGYLGVIPADIDDEDRARFQLLDDEGMRLANVVPDGPAAKSGLKAGDILVRIDGKNLQLRNLGVRLFMIGAGETVDVELVRDGVRMHLPLTLGARPER